MLHVYAVPYEPGGTMASGDLPALDRLPSTFRYSEARALMNERAFRGLLSQHRINRLARGLYRKSDADGDEDLIEIAGQRPRATLCLRSALSRHDLIDDIPAAIDVALPRNTEAAEARTPVNWHWFDPKTFDIGRELLRLDETTNIGLYSAERSIIDAFRLRHLEGPELGNEALRRWLRRGGQPSTLTRIARSFPKAAPALQRSLEVLL
jgi:predicted transcriptional regulator of viral defense system